MSKFDPKSKEKSVVLNRHDLPSILTASGADAVKLYTDFIEVSTKSSQTALTYRSVTMTFLKYCDTCGIEELQDVEPGHIKAYLYHRDKELGKTGSAPTHFAAVRSMFHYFVANRLLTTNPATSVKYQFKRSTEGKTPVVTGSEIRALLSSIIPETIDENSVIKQTDYRDRALIALMAYTFIRIGGALSAKVKHYTVYEGERWIEVGEKGDKTHKLPVLGEARIYMDEYLDLCGLWEPEAFIFQSANRNGQLSGKPYDRNNSRRMIISRAKRAGISSAITNHTFRATGITRYLESGGTLAKAQEIANHSDSSTTRLYDRRGKSGLVSELKKVRYE